MKILMLLVVLFMVSGCSGIKDITSIFDSGAIVSCPKCFEDLNKEGIEAKNAAATEKLLKEYGVPAKGEK